MIAAARRPQDGEARAESNRREKRVLERRLQGRIESGQRPVQPVEEAEEHRHRQAADDGRRDVVTGQQRQLPFEPVADKEHQAGEGDSLDEIQAHECVETSGRSTHLDLDVSTDHGVLVDARAAFDVNDVRPGSTESRGRRALKPYPPLLPCNSVEDRSSLTCCTTRPPSARSSALKSSMCGAALARARRTPRRARRSCALELPRRRRRAGQEIAQRILRLDRRRLIRKTRRSARHRSWKTPLC